MPELELSLVKQRSPYSYYGDAADSPLQDRHDSIASAALGRRGSTLSTPVSRLRGLGFPSGGVMPLTSRSQDTFLRFGDVIAMYCTETNAFVSAGGLIVEDCFVTRLSRNVQFPPNLLDSLFEITPQYTYSRQEKLRTYLYGKGIKGDTFSEVLEKALSAKESDATLAEMVDLYREEENINSSQSSRLRGQALLHGSQIQLRHVTSGKFVTLKRVATQMLKTGVNIQLDKDGSMASWFTIQHAIVHAAGTSKEEPIRRGGDVVLQSSLFKGQYMAVNQQSAPMSTTTVPPSEYVQGTYAMYARDSAYNWRIIHCGDDAHYATHSDVLYGCDLVTVYNQTTDSLLFVRENDDGELSVVLGRLDPDDDTIKANALWLILSEDVEGCCVPLEAQSQRYRLFNVATGTYIDAVSVQVTVNDDDGGLEDGVGETYGESFALTASAGYGSIGSLWRIHIGGNIANSEGAINNGSDVHFSTDTGAWLSIDEIDKAEEEDTLVIGSLGCTPSYNGRVLLTLNKLSSTLKSTVANLEQNMMQVYWFLDELRKITQDIAADLPSIHVPGPSHTHDVVVKPLKDEPVGFFAEVWHKPVSTALLNMLKILCAEQPPPLFDPITLEVSASRQAQEIFSELGGTNMLLCCLAEIPSKKLHQPQYANLLHLCQLMYRVMVYSCRGSTKLKNSMAESLPLFESHIDSDIGSYQLLIELFTDNMDMLESVTPEQVRRYVSTLKVKKRPGVVKLLESLCIYEEDAYIKNQKYVLNEFFFSGSGRTSSQGGERPGDTTEDTSSVNFSPFYTEKIQDKDLMVFDESPTGMRKWISLSSFRESANDILRRDLQSLNAEDNHYVYHYYTCRLLRAICFGQHTPAIVCVLRQPRLCLGFEALNSILHFPRIPSVTRGAYVNLLVVLFIDRACFEKVEIVQHTKLWQDGNISDSDKDIDENPSDSGSGEDEDVNAGMPANIEQMRTDMRTLLVTLIKRNAQLRGNDRGQASLILSIENLLSVMLSSGFFRNQGGEFDELTSALLGLLVTKNDEETMDMDERFQVKTRLCAALNTMLMKRTDVGIGIVYEKFQQLYASSPEITAKILADESFRLSEMEGTFGMAVLAFKSMLSRRRSDVKETDEIAMPRKARGRSSMLGPLTKRTRSSTKVMAEEDTSHFTKDVLVKRLWNGGNVQQALHMLEHAKCLRSNEISHDDSLVQTLLDLMRMNSPAVVTEAYSLLHRHMLDRPNFLKELSKVEVIVAERTVKDFKYTQRKLNELSNLQNGLLQSQVKLRKAVKIMREFVAYLQGITPTGNNFRDVLRNLGAHEVVLRIISTVDPSRHQVIPDIEMDIQNILEEAFLFLQYFCDGNDANQQMIYGDLRSLLQVGMVPSNISVEVAIACVKGNNAVCRRITSQAVLRRIIDTFSDSADLNCRHRVINFLEYIIKPTGKPDRSKQELVMHVITEDFDVLDFGDGQQMSMDAKSHLQNIKESSVEWMHPDLEYFIALLHLFATCSRGNRNTSIRVREYLPLEMVMQSISELFVVADNLTKKTKEGEFHPLRMQTSPDVLRAVLCGYFRILDEVYWNMESDGLAVTVDSDRVWGKARQTGISRMGVQQMKGGNMADLPHTPPEIKNRIRRQSLGGAKGKLPGMPDLAGDDRRPTAVRVHTGGRKFASRKRIESPEKTRLRSLTPAMESEGESEDTSREIQATVTSSSIDKFKNLQVDVETTQESDSAGPLQKGEARAVDFNVPGHISTPPSTKDLFEQPPHQQAPPPSSQVDMARSSTKTPSSALGSMRSPRGRFGVSSRGNELASNPSIENTFQDNYHVVSNPPPLVSERNDSEDVAPLISDPPLTPKLFRNSAAREGGGTPNPVLDELRNEDADGSSSSIGQAIHPEGQGSPAPPGADRHTEVSEMDNDTIGPLEVDRLNPTNDLHLSSLTPGTARSNIGRKGSDSMNGFGLGEPKQPVDEMLLHAHKTMASRRRMSIPAKDLMNPVSDAPAGAANGGVRVASHSDVGETLIIDSHNTLISRINDELEVFLLRTKGATALAGLLRSSNNQEATDTVGVGMQARFIFEGAFPLLTSYIDIHYDSAARDPVVLQELIRPQLRRLVDNAAKVLSVGSDHVTSAYRLTGQQFLDAVKEKNIRATTMVDHKKASVFVKNSKDKMKQAAAYREQLGVLWIWKKWLQYFSSCLGYDDLSEEMSSGLRPLAALLGDVHHSAELNNLILLLREHSHYLNRSVIHSALNLLRGILYVDTEGGASGKGGKRNWDEFHRHVPPSRPKASLARTQVRLTKERLCEVAVLHSQSMHSDLVISALRLLSVMLHGPNKTVQGDLISHLRKTNNSKFFSLLCHKMRRFVERCAKWNDERTQTTESVFPDTSAFMECLRIVKSTCTNNVDGQNLMRQQPGNSVEYNVVAEVTRVLREIFPICAQTLDEVSELPAITCELLRCLLEFVHGHNIENKAVILSSAFIDLINEVLVKYRYEGRTGDSAKYQFRVLFQELLRELIDGLQDVTISQRILNGVVWDNVFNSISHSYNLSRRRGGDTGLKSANLLDEAQQLYFIVRTMMVHEMDGEHLTPEKKCSTPWCAMYKRTATKCLRHTVEHTEKSSLSHFAKMTNYIEIIRLHNVEPVFFKLPEKYMKVMYDTAYKNQLLQGIFNVPRDNPREKAQGYLTKMKNSVVEFYHRERLLSSIFSSWLVKFETFIVNAPFVMAVIICFTVLFSIDEITINPYHTYHHFVLYFLVISLGFIHLFSACIMLLWFCCARLPLLWWKRASRIRETDGHAGKKHKASQKKGDSVASFRKVGCCMRLWYTITTPLVYYYLLFVIFSVFGIAIHPFFFSFHLLHVYRYKGLQDTMRAVTENFARLVQVSFVAMIAIFFFTIYARLFLQDLDAIGRCGTMPGCYAHLLVNTQSDGDLWSDDNDMEFDEMIFRVAYVTICVIFFVGIYQGIIIDTFGKLRDQAKAEQEDLQRKCFVCSSDRYTIESSGVTFQHHVNYQHNPWTLFLYLIYLHEKSAEKDTSQDAYARKMISSSNIGFLPIQRALCLESGSGLTAPNAEDDSDGIRRQPHRPLAVRTATGMNGEDESIEQMLRALLTRVMNLEKQFPAVQPNKARNSTLRPLEGDPAKKSRNSTFHMIRNSLVVGKGPHDDMVQASKYATMTQVSEEDFTPRSLGNVEFSSPPANMSASPRVFTSDRAQSLAGPARGRFNSSASPRTQSFAAAHRGSQPF